MEVCGLEEQGVEKDNRRSESSILQGVLLILGLFVLISIGMLFFIEVKKAIFVSSLLLILIFVTLFYLYYFRYNYYRFNKVNSKKYNIVKILFICIIGSVILEGLTLIGDPSCSIFDLSKWNYKRILTFIIITYCLQVIPKLYIILKIKNKNDIISYNNSIKYLCISASLIIFIAVLCGILQNKAISMNQRVLFSITVLLVTFIELIYIIKKDKNIVNIFIVLAISSGSIFSFCAPPLTGISWDDQIHFDRAYGLSYIDNAPVSDVNAELVNIEWVKNGILQYDKINDAIYRINNELEKAKESNNFTYAYALTEAYSSKSIANITLFGYIPNAVGLWISRLFFTSFTAQLIIGRWSSLIFYVIIVSIAISILPIKKSLFAVIGLVPMSVFLASSYSYDTWIISFMILSCALFFKIYYSDKSFSIFYYIIMLFTMLIAIFIKAIYFPLLLIFVFLIQKKYNNKYYKSIIFILTILLIFYIVCTFVFPMLLSSSVQAGDSRGGSDVNALGQIKFIINNPLYYMKLIISFLLSYFAPINSDQYTVQIGYLALIPEYIPILSTVSFIVLVVSSYTSFYGSKVVLNRSLSITSIILVIISISIATTAIYVDINSVGSNVINGMQGRYLLPLLVFIFPFLYLSNSGVTKNNISDKINISIFLMYIILLISIYITVIPWNSTLMHVN